MRTPLVGPLLAILLAVPAVADEPVDLGVVTRIRDEGFARSKVMDTLSEMCDGIGPRLTGSPNMKKASQWAKKKFEDWGLANAHAESFAPIARSWTWESASVEMTSPVRVSMLAVPKAWTPGTSGVVKGAPVFAPLESIWKESSAPELDKWIEKWKGKLAGKIVLITPMPKLKPGEKPDARRETRESLEEIAQFEPGGGPWEPSSEELISFLGRAEKLRKAIDAEKPAALVYSGGGSDGTMHVDGTYQHRKTDLIEPPSVVIQAESYGRIARLLERKLPVELELSVNAALGDDDPDAEVNTIAEIPGTDPKRKDEVVLIGAHFDSWHGGTGATDNGAGAAVVMEAARILKAIGVSPRRTIRVALWSGEEQGLYGSWAYATRHYASSPDTTDPEQLKLWPYARKLAGPITLKPEHAKLAAYFNLDNGAGKIRGIYCQENSAVRPIFESWLEPFHDLGAETVTLRNTGGTDHLAFDAFGLPGFQFIQDELDYVTRTHHTNVDTWERAPKMDMMQASVVLASFAYNAAMRDEKLPRKPMRQYRPEEKKKADAETAAKAHD